MGRIGDAQHGIVRRVKARFGKLRRVGRDQRQVAGIGQRDQRLFRGFLHRIVAPGDLDIEPFGKQPLQPLAIGLGRVLLALGQQPRQRALARAAESARSATA